MALSTGTRLGPYEIHSAIGAGGMGEVYRARDTKLNRDVALKVLPNLFAADPDRLARFKREAQVLASLNHPNIAAIHGFEDADGIHALALELVEGPTLADRIAQGPIPLDEALPIAKQIAEALEAAHTHGIIHRDLKPANIKVRHDGTVKVLDFGLAKAMESDGGGTAADVTHSPTISLTATRMGVILGTAAYMAPEQAKGRAVDKRVDVWAFGCVLYEMLTGKRAFPGDDVSESIASVLAREPDVAALPATLPFSLRRLLSRCLEKDLKRRLRDIGDALLEIDEESHAAAGGKVAAGSVEVPKRGWRGVMPWAVAVVASIATGLAVWTLRPQLLPPQVTRLVVASPGGALTLAGQSVDIALSPDGRRIVYSADGARLFVRALDQLEATPLAGLSQSVFNPFISPDGAWIGFNDQTDGTLKKVSVLGGPPVVICRVAGVRGASWGSDDTIIFATNNSATGLFRVSARGGEPELLTTPDIQRGSDHVWPEVLPNGRGVLFTIMSDGGAEEAQIALLNLETREQRILVPGGSSPKFARSGHIVYSVAGTLRAVMFDPERLEVLSNPVPVVQDVVTKASGAADFALASDGSLVYVAGSTISQRLMVWVDRQGREEIVKAPPRPYAIPRLSPDGSRVVFQDATGESDLWIYEFRRGTFERLTFDRGADRDMAWSPDGTLIAYYASGRDGGPGIFRRAADGTGDPVRLTTGLTHLPMSWSPDGSSLLFLDLVARDLGVIGLRGQSSPQALMTTPAAEDIARISPDGRWLALETNETGQREIFVRPFPNVATGRTRISVDGGVDPVWARDGRTLFYRKAQALMAVAVNGDAPSNWGRPQRLFEGQYAFVDGPTWFDAAPDGRLLMLKNAPSGDSSAAPPEIVVVLNWLEELKRLVPAN